MPRMGAYERLRGLFRAPPSPESPRFEQQRWNNSLGFTLNAPPEITGLMAYDGLNEPRIDRATAMQVPAVKRVRDLICGTLGTMQPRMIDSTNRTVDSELLDQPESDVARSITMTNLLEDMLFEKHGWWRIVGYGADGYPSKVVRLEPRSVTVREEGQVWTNSRTGNAQGQSWNYVPDAELIRFDSPSDALLEAGAAAIRQALLLGRAASRYARNPMPLGFFTPASEDYAPGDKTKVDEMLDHFEEQTQRRAWAYMDGMKAQTLSWSPEQMALTAQRDQAVLEIARLGGVDPEELGVSTTSRTYANSETRRLDLIDFTLLMYVTAIEDRLKMDDVSQPGRRAVYDYSGFLRSDTLSRMQAYKAGVELGVYTPERIAEIERIPVASVRKALKLLEEKEKPTPPAPAQRPIPAQTGQAPKVQATMDTSAGAGVLAFSQASQSIPVSQSAVLEQHYAGDPGLSTQDAGVSLNFAANTDLPDELAFRADGEKRVVAGMIVPFNQVAWSAGRQWEFAPGSLHWSALGRVKLDEDHKDGTEFGVATLLDNRDVGYFGKFKVGRGARASELLLDAVDGIRDGFSVFVDFSGPADGWTDHPMKPGVRLVHSATLRKVALTAIPSFDDARTAYVAANREGQNMTGPTNAGVAQVAAGVPAALAGPAYTQDQVNAAFAAGQAAAQQQAAAFASTLAETFGPALAEALKPIVDALPAPGAVDGSGRPVVKAGAGITEVVEPPVYRLNGHGFSLVRDTWKHRTEGDHEAGERLRKFSRQTEEASKKAMDALAFGATTGNASAVIPPGYRPELFVTQLMQGRPLVNSVSRGTLTDATPFNIPKYVSSSGMSAEHVEGVNPSDGTLNLGIATVSPTAISGKFTLTREIVDSANPAIDAIAVAAMQEAYSQQTEAIVYTELNGPNGQGGTITSGFVPSGAQVSTTTGAGIAGSGDELLAGVRAANALYPFRRFGAANRAHISQEAASCYAGAVDGANRPLLPFEAPQNVVGTSSPMQGGYRVDGLLHVPTWSMTGNAAGDADVIEFNSQDIWAWESALLMFRFEERNGPAFIDLALFGYFAARVLRPVGIMAVRHTVT
jgi:phage portal protein BeeE/phage head maturation protease